MKASMKTRLITLFAAAVLVPGMALAAQDVAGAKTDETTINNQYVNDATTASDTMAVTKTQDKKPSKGIASFLANLAPASGIVDETKDSNLNSDTSYDANRPFPRVKGTDVGPLGCVIK